MWRVVDTLQHGLSAEQEGIARAVDRMIEGSAF